MEVSQLEWLPSAKDSCVCFSIDDIHPATSADQYEAGGDLGDGHFKNLEWLLDRHKGLKVTLFLTANWRETSAVPTRKLLARIPYINEKVYLARRWPKDKMRVDRHPKFVQYINSLPRTDIGFHGLYHCHKGPNIPIEFQDESKEEITKKIDEIERIFDKAGIRYVKGLSPPGWNAPDPLLDVLSKKKFDFIASSRDVRADISKTAMADMSGLKGVPLIYPKIVRDGLVHITTNFQATSRYERAFQILDNGGLLKIKAHIRKQTFGRSNLDGLDEAYANYLDLLLKQIEDRYGDRIWWASLNDVAKQVKMIS
jgi:predicted deacetylase